MKKTIPIYILLLAILVVFVLQLRETKAMRNEMQTELAGIRSEQIKQPRRTGGPPMPPWGGIPVYVTNDPLDVSIER